MAWEFHYRLLVAALLAIVCILLDGCHAQPSATSAVKPAIEFTLVPLAEAGTPDKLSKIEGHVTGAKPGQQIVLYARAGNAWWVQPFAAQPFTRIQPDSKWSSTTHPGTHYAALLVGPDFQARPTLDALPTAGVAVFAVTRGVPVFWQRWWFILICLIAAAGAIFGVHRLRLRQATRRLSLRFEERLAERTRIAQELHDTMLQGFLSASMQLHIANDQLPEDWPAKPIVSRVLELMGQVIDDGRKAVRGLRPSIAEANDLQQALTRIPQDFELERPMDFRVIVEGQARPLHPVIRDEVYRIGREALANAFRHSRASGVEVELEYADKQLRVLVRDNGCGIKPNVVRSGRDGHWGLSDMRERAERIGGKLKVSTSGVSGTEVELTVPGRLAFESHRSHRASKWLMKLYAKEILQPESGKGAGK